MMKKIVILLCLVLISCILVTNTQGVEGQQKPTTIVVYGIEKNSGNTILAEIEMTNEQFSAKEDLSGPLNYKVIARGVFSPSQGSNNSVVYWRYDKLWRYVKGMYRQLNENGDAMSIRPVTYEPIIYKEKTASIEKVPAAIKYRERRLTTEGDYYSAIWNYDVAIPTRMGYSSEPIGWIDSTRLLVREYLEDRIGRLKEANFFIAKFDPTHIEDEGKRGEVFSSSANIQEIMAAVSQTKVALQVYDDRTDSFNLGIRELDKDDSILRWVSLPIHPVRGTDFYKTFLAKSRILEMKWSPDGRYLEVRTSSNGVSLWDDLERKWVQFGNHITFSGSMAPTIWIDSNQVVTLEHISSDSAYLKIKRISNFDTPFINLGTIKGIEVQKIFLVDVN